MLHPSDQEIIVAFLREWAYLQPREQSLRVLRAEAAKRGASDI